MSFPLITTLRRHLIRLSLGWLLLSRACFRFIYKRISQTYGSSVFHSDVLYLHHSACVSVKCFNSFLLSVSGQCSLIFTPCIVPMFLLSQSINRGNLRSAVISRFSAKPLRSYRFPSLASASSDRLLSRWSTILGYYPFDPGCFTKNLWAFPMLAWLLHCRCTTRCATPGCRV